MRTASLCAALAAAALLAPIVGGRALAADKKAGTKPASAAVPARSGVESGVYGFSGALKAGTSMQGVMGECIWIYDGDNKKEVAKGDCDQGNFRVPLKPGHYVVRGPGGNEKIEVKPHQWVKIRSLVKLPGEL
ncbi:MAG TPA: hypothetical protein VNF49_04065 [Candidatus Binataceae bacterium]|nr:hypothetical protein [Candidatus Binataceae bacterium]